MSKKNKNYYKNKNFKSNQENVDSQNKEKKPNNSNFSFNKKQNNQQFFKVVNNQVYSKLVEEDVNVLESDTVAPELECCFCHKSIEKVSLAIDVPNKNTPAHFECVIERLKATEQLKENENIAYIGNRKFAVVIYRKNGTSFDIVREIPFEDNNDFKNWRNSFSVKLRKKLI